MSFPTNIDNFTNPLNTDKLNNPSHSQQHANLNDAVEALEAKVGANSSAVTTSHDYKLSGVTGTDKSVSLTGTEVLTNKTLTTPTIASFTNATHTHTSNATGGAIPRAALVFTSGRGYQPTTVFNNTEYSDTHGADSDGATETDCGNIMPANGTLKNLYIDMFFNSLNSGNAVFTLMKNGVATSVTVTVAFGVTSITGDIVNTASASAGDRISLRCVTGGTNGTCTYSFSYMLELT